MNKSGKQLKRHALALWGLLLFSVSAVTVAQTDVQVENDGLTIRAIISSADNVLSTSIRVVGPDDFVFEDRIEDGALQWIPEGDLTDGFYSWEIWTVTVSPGAPMLQISAPQAAAPARVEGEGDGERTSSSSERKQANIAIPVERFFDAADKRVHTESGTFEVRDGWMIPSVNPDESTTQNQPAGGLLGSIAGAVIDFVFPSAHADCPSPCNVDSTGNSDVHLNADTDGNAGGPFEVELEVLFSNGRFQIGPVGGNTEPFRLELDAPEDSLRISSSGDIGLGTSTPADPLHISDPFPIIRLQDNNDAQTWSIFANQVDFAVHDFTAGTFPIRIEPTAPTDSIHISPVGNVGIGLGTPSDDLHVLDTNGFQVRLDDGINWTRLDQFGGIFRIGSNTNSNQFRLFNSAPQNSLVVAGSGNVGVGTDTPEFNVDVLSSTGLGQIRITETNGSNGLTMFALENTGHPRFRLRNSTLNSNWDFRTAGSDASNNEQFQITNFSNGESNFLFRLFKNGDLEVEGDVTANGVLLTSSRESKTDFEPLNEEQVLDQLSQLEISKWRYKHEKEGTQHFGPIAEDFHSIFGLSDGKHLNMIDVGGIAFAAIQALNEKKNVLERQNQELQKRLERLEESILH